VSNWHCAALVVGLGTLTCFAGAILFYFRRDSVPPRGGTVLLLGITACGTVQVIALFVSHDVPVWCRCAGLLMFAVAHTVFWSAVVAHGRTRPQVAFSTAAPARLVTSGPYRWVRHPFYSAYLLAWAAGAAVTAAPMLAVCVCVMGMVYWSAARREEAAILASSLREEYAAYSRRTGMFLPW
jgi:protein-S-isoprenylcysteine O-methyltransferase Ste14